MDSSPRCFALLLLIGSVSVLVYASSIDDDFHSCGNAVNKWFTSEFNDEVKEDKHTLRDLLFFLHIPRTGGRTYFHCFLKKLYSSQLECPRSYDKLRFNPRKASCRLLVTHDDYSMMAKLPKEKTSLVTILRNPVDRVLSTYEFSSERKARLQKNQNYVERNDSYNMEDIAMPLHQYMSDPIAMDIVHNGATFQVAGPTNNSYLSESHEVRTCVQKYPSLGKSVLEVAKVGSYAVCWIDRRPQGFCDNICTCGWCTGHLPVGGIKLHHGTSS